MKPVSVSCHFSARSDSILKSEIIQNAICINEFLIVQKTALFPVAYRERSFGLVIEIVVILIDSFIPDIRYSLTRTHTTSMRPHQTLYSIAIMNDMDRFCVPGKKGAQSTHEPSTM